MKEVVLFYYLNDKSYPKLLKSKPIVLNVLALPTTALKDIVFRFIRKYSSLRDFDP